MQAKIKEYKEKSQKAISDKAEILRDLATYEHNFSIQKSENNATNLQQKLLSFVAMIKKLK